MYEKKCTKHFRINTLRMKNLGWMSKAPFCLMSLKHLWEVSSDCSKKLQFVLLYNYFQCDLQQVYVYLPLVADDLICQISVLWWDLIFVPILFINAPDTRMNFTLCYFKYLLDWRFFITHFVILVVINMVCDDISLCFLAKKNLWPRVTSKVILCKQCVWIWFSRYCVPLLLAYETSSVPWKPGYTWQA